MQLKLISFAILAFSMGASSAPVPLLIDSSPLRNPLVDSPPLNDEKTPAPAGRNHASLATLSQSGVNKRASRAPRNHFDPSSLSGSERTHAHDIEANSISGITGSNLRRGADINVIGLADEVINDESSHSGSQGHGDPTGAGTHESRQGPGVSLNSGINSTPC